MKAKKYKIFVSLAVCALVMLVFGFDLLGFSENRMQDWTYQQPGLTDPDIVVVGIDEKALDRFGAYQQWSRQIMTDAINILNGDEDFRPAVIAIDVLYSEEGADKEADAALAEACANGGNVVLASHLESVGMAGSRIVTSYQRPFPQLEPHVSYGLVNAGSDSDGVIRDALLKLRYNDDLLYSFPTAIIRQYTGDTPDRFLEENNEAYIKFTGLPGDYYGASFADIFDEDFDPAFFDGCILLIGPYATGMMDAHNTSVSHDTQMYGVEVHANVVQMMLDGQYKQRVPAFTLWLILIALLLLGILLGEYLDIRVLLAVFVALAAGYYFGAKWLYSQGYILTLLYPIVALVIIYLYQLIYGYVVHAMEKARLRSTFKKYVDPKLVDKLIESGEADSDAVGRKRDIAVLFVDVRGFTPMTEALRETPELVVQTLNEYLELTSSSVFNNGGSVDKFVGDATVALFNGFVPLDDYVYKAVKAAWDMVQGADDVNASIKEKYGVDVGFGIGINCGEAIVGNLGPSFRKDYTAIGDTVNTAARLEANAKRSQILISRAVYEAVQDRVGAESIGEIPLKGKSIPLEVFAVTNVK